MYKNAWDNAYLFSVENYSTFVTLVMLTTRALTYRSIRHGNLHTWKGRLSAENTLGGLKSLYKGLVTTICSCHFCLISMLLDGTMMESLQKKSTMALGSQSAQCFAFKVVGGAVC